jgi:hypothetical protein
MKLLATCFFASALATSNLSFAATGGSHGVRGYVKKDGTYVAPHKKTNANGTQTDNWSSKPNMNPYTGKKGFKEAEK